MKTTARRGASLGRLRAFHAFASDQKSEREGRARLEAFSDAVFAVAITLLVVDLHVPDLPPERASSELLGSLLALWPKVFSWLISFVVIGGFWVNHHQFFRVVRRVDRPLLWLNLLRLLCIAFLPFPTAVYGTYGGEVVAVDLYALTVALVGLSGAAVAWHAARTHLLDGPRLAYPAGYFVLRSLVVTVVAVAVVVLSAVISPENARYAWLLIPVLDGALDRLARRGQPQSGH